MSTIAALLVTLVLPSFCAAQSTDVFAVASVRPNLSGLAYSPAADRADGVSLVNERLRDIILLAFGIHDFQLADAPGWISDARFDVNARANRSLSMDEKRAGLRQLLAVRFDLRVREITREQTIYRLNRRGPGAGLKARDCAVPGLAGLPCGRGIGAADGGVYRMAGVSSQDLAGFFSGVIGRLVVDETGMTGLFDVDLQWRPDIGSSPDLSDAAKARIETRPALPVALREQLGLELESARVPVSVFVIERIARPSPQ